MTTEIYVMYGSEKVKQYYHNFCGEMSEFVGGLLWLVRSKSGPLNLLGSVVTFDRQCM